MRVLVSGGTGLVGRGIVEVLLAAGHAVTVGGRRAPAADAFAQPVAFAPLSLDPAEPADVFAGIDAFVHCAFDHLPGRYRGGESGDPGRFIRLNRDGSIRLFAEARAAGVGRVIFLSSRAVYDGLAPDAALDETAACAPDSLYGQVKLETEQGLAALHADNFLGASLRATGVYDGLRPNKWDGLIADYLAGRPVAPRAGSEVHGRDVGAAVRLLLETPGDVLGGGVFNLSDIVTDTREILGHVRAVTGAPHPLPAPADLRELRVMETGRIRALGWQPGGRDLFARTVRALATSDSHG